MKRIYTINKNGTKTLQAYDYEGIIIEVDYTESRSYYRPWKRDGYKIPKLKELGIASWRETLKEAIEAVNVYLLK